MRHLCEKEKGSAATQKAMETIGYSLASRSIDCVRAGSAVVTWRVESQREEEALRLCFQHQSLESEPVAESSTFHRLWAHEEETVLE